MKEKLKIWKNYKDQYLNLILSFEQARLITFVAGTVLKDFPRNLPNELKKIIIDLLMLTLQRNKAFLKYMKDNEGKIPVSILDEEVKPERINVLLSEIDKLAIEVSNEDINRALDSPICRPWSTIGTIHAKLRKKGILEIDYQNFFFQQQIVMSIAYIEAFIGDTIRAICRAKPEVITSSQKQVTWEIAFDYPDRDSLLDFLTEEFVSATLQSKDIPEVISALTKNHGIDLKVEQDSIKAIILAEQIRHIIVHTGGRVDRKFLKKTGNLTASLGEPFPIDEKFIEDTASACINIAQALFDAVSKKFYGLSDAVRLVGIKLGRQPRKTNNKL
jgi:hypothetical protein